jgi:hypothetical protein
LEFSFGVQLKGKELKYGKEYLGTIVYRSDCFFFFIEILGNPELYYN